MKVYILWYSYHEYGEDIDTIYGIYDSMDKANKSIEYYKVHYPMLVDYLRVEEYTLDEVKE